MKSISKLTFQRCRSNPKRDLDYPQKIKNLIVLSFPLHNAASSFFLATPNPFSKTHGLNLFPTRFEFFQKHDLHISQNPQTEKSVQTPDWISPQKTIDSFSSHVLNNLSNNHRLLSLFTRWKNSPHAECLLPISVLDPSFFYFFIFKRSPFLFSIV